MRFDRQTPLFAFLIVVFCWFLPGLLGHEPWKPDEAYYFGLIRGVVESGDWVVPTLTGEPFMEKPPLFLVTGALFIKLFGGLLGEPDAARLTTGFYVALALTATALGAREILGRGAGRWAALILMGCIGGLTHTHKVATDMALFAGIAIGLYGYLLGLRRTVAGGITLGIGAAMTFMCKGLLGPGLLGLTGLCLPFAAKEFRSWRYLHFLAVALLAFLPVPVLWMSALWIRSRELFDLWFWTNNIGRFDGSNSLGPESESFFYFKLLPWYALPALPMAIWALWSRRRKPMPVSWRVPLLFFVLGFTALSLASDACELYAMPLLPPLAILGTCSLVYSKQKDHPLRYVLIGFFMLMATLLWLVGLSIAFGWMPWLWRHIQNEAPGFVAHREWVFLFSAAALTIVMLGLMVHGPAGCRRLTFIWATGIALTWGLVMTLGMPLLDYAKSYAPAFRQLRTHLPANECVASQNLAEAQRAMVDYYAGLKTRRLETHPKAGECNYLLVQLDLPATPKPVAGELLWEGSRPGDLSEHYLLYRLSR